MSSKARYVKEPYSGNALKLKEELLNSVSGSACYDTMYIHKKGFKWLLNSRGYIHMWVMKNTHMTFDGERCTYYLIEHYRVTSSGKLQEIGHSLYSDHEAMEQAFAELQ